jgi:DNA polymerase (family 10)
MKRVTNSDIADVLEQIADLLELASEDQFRVRTYRRAADTVVAYPEELANLRARDKLTDVPGIGKSLAEKIGEYLDQGRMTYLDELRARFPAGVVEMLSIPGFGPRSAARVYEELGLTSIDELEAAAGQGRLREVKGFGPKVEEKLLHNIGLYREAGERALLSEILPVAEALVARLQAMPQVLRCEMAGSTRRRRETVGDLDILTTSDEPAKVSASARKFDEFVEVVAAGDTKVSGRITGARQVDIRVVPPDSYGAALQYFTGSQQHNIALRSRALKMGLTVNEYGVFRLENGETGEKVAGADEDEVYQALGLPWIPPELREARGEIEAAEAGKLPRLLELSDIRGDLQMHTRFSDGHQSVRQMADAARGLGYDYIGITDHSPSLAVAHGMSIDEIKRQHDEIAEVNGAMKSGKRGFTVLHGIEADIMPDGSLDLPDEVFPLFDYVIGSLHQGFSPDAKRMTARAVAAISSGRMDFMAHPTGRVLLQREAYGLDLDAVLEAALAAGVAMEINAFPNRLDLSDVNARHARDLGVLLTINTDSHDMDHLQFMQYGVYTARRGWIEARNVINTWNVEKLRKWFGKRRS